MGGSYNCRPNASNGHILPTLADEIHCKTSGEDTHGNLSYRARFKISFVNDYIKPSQLDLPMAYAVFPRKNRE